MNDYPTEADLLKIEDWPYNDLLGLLDFVEGIYPTYGWMKRTGKRIQHVTFVTGGWSGCEDIIRALDKNVGFMTGWEASYKGGKHVYRIRDFKS